MPRAPLVRRSARSRRSGYFLRTGEGRKSRGNHRVTGKNSRTPCRTVQRVSVLSLSQKGALACEPAGALPHSHRPTCCWRGPTPAPSPAPSSRLPAGRRSAVRVEGPGEGPVRRGRCTMPAPYLSHAKAVRVCRAGGCDHSPCLARDKIPVTSARCTALPAARIRTIRERFAGSLRSEHPLGASPRCPSPSGSPV